MASASELAQKIMDENSELVNESIWEIIAYNKFPDLRKDKELCTETAILLKKMAFEEYRKENVNNA